MTQMHETPQVLVSVLCAVSGIASTISTGMLSPRSCAGTHEIRVDLLPEHRVATELGPQRPHFVAEQTDSASQGCCTVEVRDPKSPKMSESMCDRLMLLIRAYV